MANEQISEQAEAPPSIKEFLEEVPPGQEKEVSDLTEYKRTSGSAYRVLKLPILNLYCDKAPTCEGTRQFRSTDVSAAKAGQFQDVFVEYLCKNCSRTLKTFALRLRANAEGDGGLIYKYGELPNFGPPTPARLTRLLGKDGPLFLKGRIAENQGMGIAAFAYYRRVIESQKDALFDEIIRVSKAIGSDPEIIQSLEKGKKEIQFSNAIEDVKIAIPDALLINGYNPLTLLHSALSHRLHAGTDAECLTDAMDARIVLAEFVTRMADAMKDEVGLKSAVTRLANLRSRKEVPPQST